ncbi:MAG: sigma-70 family RNA polymerase sigma factor [Candidatus Eremiobacteraeota bacterium]|nr:sigma-70 family RNA polymerase sigma factor [Candidatus Eremiobacteraeota bacterium]
MTPPDVAYGVEALFRRDADRCVAVLARALGDLDRAEDAIAEAFAVALERWPEDGFPHNPAAWILTTARRRAIDALRRERRGAEKQALAARLEASLPPSIDETRGDVSAIPDERLELIFACCHPSLQMESRVALTLRSLAGLTTEEIAAAFLVPVATMAQRIVRSKRKIREAVIPFDVPPLSQLPERLADVCTVLYLIFNQGYFATAGPSLMRTDLCEEAIRLTRLLDALMPAEPEVLGLLSLMLFTHARREVRIDGAGELVTLEEQDRSRWDAAMAGEASGVLTRAARHGTDGPFQLMAAIAAVHANAATAAQTDWQAIVTLYDRLLELAPTPVVALNRAVAVGFAKGAQDGLLALDAAASDGRLDDYSPYYVARAELARRAGDEAVAKAALQRAVALTKNERERAFLQRRLNDRN